MGASLPSHTHGVFLIPMLVSVVAAESSSAAVTEAIVLWYSVSVSAALTDHGVYYSSSIPGNSVAISG